MRRDLLGLSSDSRQPSSWCVPGQLGSRHSLGLCHTSWEADICSRISKVCLYPAGYEDGILIALIAPSKEETGEAGGWM